MEAFFDSLQEVLARGLDSKSVKTPPTITLEFQVMSRRSNGDAEEDEEVDLEELNFNSERPTWAPYIVDGERFLALHVLALDETIQKKGVGRRICNIMMQSLTRCTGPQYLVVLSCHLPMFFTLDSFHGMVRTKNIHKGAEAMTIYPRHLNTKDLGELQENQRAFRRYTDLLWSTPETWAIARIETFGTSRELNAAAIRSVRALCKGDRFGGDGGVRVVALSQCPFPVGREALRTAVAAHCLALGNPDAAGDPCALVVEDRFATGETFECDCRFAFLVDHSRVFFRPIIMTAAVATKLCALMNLGSLTDICKDGPWTPLLPVPAPAFTLIDDTHWLWIPVRKPHSSNQDGSYYFPLPHAETVPFSLISIVDERPTKRARPSLDCLHCAMPHVGKDGQLAFCSQACSSDYYK
jgi:hypothetical protein